MSDSFESSSSSSSSSSANSSFEASSAENSPQQNQNNKRGSSSSNPLQEEQQHQQQPQKSKEQKIQEALASVLAAGSWKAVKDPKGRTYYYNTLTLKTTWDLVKELNLDEEVEGPTRREEAAAARHSRSFSSSSSSEEDEATTLRRMKQWSGVVGGSPSNISPAAKSLSASHTQFRAFGDDDGGAFGGGGSAFGGGDDDQENNNKSSSSTSTSSSKHRGDDGMNTDKPFVAFGGGDRDYQTSNDEFEASSGDEKTPAKQKKNTHDHNESSTSISPPSSRREGSFTRHHVSGIEDGGSKPPRAPPSSSQAAKTSTTRKDSSPFSKSSSSSSSFTSSSSDDDGSEFEKSTPSEKNVDVVSSSTLMNKKREISPAQTSSSGFSEAPPETPVVDYEAIAAAEAKQKKLEQERKDEEERARQRHLAEQEKLKQEQTLKSATTVQPHEDAPKSTTPPSTNNNFSSLGAALLAIGRGQADPSTLTSSSSTNNTNSINSTSVIQGSQPNPLQRPSAEQLISVNDSVTTQLINQSRQNLLLPSQRYELQQQEALDLRTKSEALRNLAEAYTALVTRRVVSDDSSTRKKNNKSSSSSPMEILLQERKRQKSEDMQKQQIVDALRTVLTQKQLGIDDDILDDDNEDQDKIAETALSKEQKIRQRLRKQLYETVDHHHQGEQSRVVYKELPSSNNTKRKPTRLASRLLGGGGEHEIGDPQKLAVKSSSSASTLSQDELSNEAILDLVVQMAVAELPKKRGGTRVHQDPMIEDEDNNIVISTDGFVKQKRPLKSSLPDVDDNDDSIPNPTQCVQEMFRQNLDRHIVAPLKRHIRSCGTTDDVMTPASATPQEVASVQRFVLSSVAKIIGELLRQVLMDEKQNKNQESAKALSATYFIKYTGPSAATSLDGKRLRHMIYRTLHCLPFEVHPVVPLSSSPANQQNPQYEPASVLIRNKAELVEASRKSDFFRLEAWVTSSHLLDANSCVLDAISAIEHFMADGYQPFNFVAQKPKENKKGSGEKGGDAEENPDHLFGLVLLPEAPILQLYRRTDREFVPASNRVSSANKKTPSAATPLQPMSNYNTNKENSSSSSKTNKAKVAFDSTAARLHLKDQDSIEQLAFLAASLTQELEAETTTTIIDNDESHEENSNDNNDDDDDPKQQYEKMLEKERKRNQKKSTATSSLSEKELRRMRESIVISTIDDLLDDDQIRSAVMRKCKSKFDQMMEEHREDPNARRKKKVESDVDFMVEQMKKEVMQENLF